MESLPCEAAPYRKRITAAICSVAAAAAFGGCTVSIEKPPKPPASSSASHDSKHMVSTEEKFLKKKLRASMLKRDVKLLCTPKLPAPAKSGEGVIEGYTVTAIGHKPSIHVPLEECDLLVSYAKATKKTTGKIKLENFEFTTIVHESEHANHPHASEAAVSCYALQETPEFVAELGGDNRQQHQAVHKGQADYRLLLPRYRSPECRDGGAYDLDPAHHGNDFPK